MVNWLHCCVFLYRDQTAYLSITGQQQRMKPNVILNRRLSPALQYQHCSLTLCAVLVMVRSRSVVPCSSVMKLVWGGLSESRTGRGGVCRPALESCSLWSWPRWLSFTCSLAGSDPAVAYKKKTSRATLKDAESAHPGPCEQIRRSHWPYFQPALAIYEKATCEFNWCKSWN